MLAVLTTDLTGYGQLVSPARERVNQIPPLLVQTLGTRESLFVRFVCRPVGGIWFNVFGRSWYVRYRAYLLNVFKQLAQRRTHTQTHEKHNNLQATRAKLGRKSGGTRVKLG